MRCRRTTLAHCEGKTEKGDRCARNTRTGLSYCSIHVDQERWIRGPRVEEWDRDSIVKAAVGFALVGVIVLFRFRR